MKEFKIILLVIILNISAKGKSNYYDFGKKIFKKIKNKNKFPKLEAIDAKNYKKIFKNNKTAVRPINSLLNVQKLEKFIDQKMPDWNYIFERKIFLKKKNDEKNKVFKT